MFVFGVFCFNLILTTCNTQDMDDLVVRSEKAEIEQFPHSVYLSITCTDLQGYTLSFSCGASVVNQQVMLTAAHCVDICEDPGYMIASAGHAHTDRGLKSMVTHFTMHQGYFPGAGINDIALVKTKTSFPFSPRISRVVLVKNLPQTAFGYVAGWGRVNEYRVATWLRYTKQPLVSRWECGKLIGKIGDGCICAGVVKGNSYAAPGDSGSALVVNNYTQIGIVSYKKADLSMSVVVYTNVPFYYRWLKANVRSLFGVSGSALVVNNYIQIGVVSYKVPAYSKSIAIYTDVPYYYNWIKDTVISLLCDYN